MMTFDEAINYYGRHQDTIYDGHGHHHPTSTQQAFNALLQKIVDTEAKVERLKKRFESTCMEHDLWGGW